VGVACCILHDQDCVTLVFILLTDRGQLSVGSYLHCAVSGSDHVDLASGESRVVSVIAEPRRVHRSEVGCVTYRWIVQYCWFSVVVAVS